mmetsp:Transcript_50659/g.127637  ORF Transcript_50659/g.127637 Transcript_50659/m.127637 type:complete len:280 (+) Transcript_50659:123-962(+)
MRVSSAFLLLIASFHDAAAVSIDIENGVYILQEATFDTVVKKFPAVMVKFYAPWCGHCKAMAPAYEKAAKKLKKAADESGEPSAHPRLAKVDATVEKDLAAKYEVTGFPTIVVFKDGELFDTYKGGRDKDDFINYMSTVSFPMPLGVALRVYYVTLGVYKEAVRLSPLPARYRKYAFMAFPGVAASPAILVIACACICCLGGCADAKSKRGRPSGKSGEEKEGEEETSASASGSGSGAGLQKRKGRSASPSAPSKPSAQAPASSGGEAKEGEGEDKKED